MQKDKIQWLDSLRVFGLVFVLAYHLLPKDAQILSGGFVGVDIFFVLSGYLTTTLIISKLQSKGQAIEKFHPLDFLVRRIKRLVPALIFMLSVVIPLLLLIPKDYRTNLFQQVCAVLGQSTNYYEISQNGSYSDRLNPHLFIHTWTLAVEVHYYILWALIIFALGFIINRVRTLRITLFSISIIVAGVSALLMFMTANDVAFTENFTPAYIATHTHLFPLMIGSAIGLLFVRGETGLTSKFKLPNSVRVMLIAVTCVVLIILAQFFYFKNVDTYHYGLLIFSLLVGFLVILLLTLGQNLKYAEPKIINYLSDRSYSVYLFHWPLFIIITAIFNENGILNTWLVAAIVVLVSFLLAEISRRFVELPFVTTNSGKKSEFKNVQNLVTAGVLFALFITSALIITNAPSKTETELELDTQSRHREITKLQNLNDSLTSLRDNKPVSANGHPEIIPIKPSQRAAMEEAEQKMRENARGAAEDSAGAAERSAARMAGVANSAAVIIGDSVTNMSTDVLRATIPTAFVDAMGNRRMCTGLDIINELKSNNILPHVVVLALGENILQADYECAAAAKEAVDDNHKLIFVTGFRNDSQTAMEKFADYLRSLAGGNVSIADWALAIGPRSAEPGMMSADHFHPASPEAKQIYANTIKDAIIKDQR